MAKTISFQDGQIVAQLLRDVQKLKAEKEDLLKLLSEAASPSDMNAQELLEWANEEVAKVECHTSQVADTGDYDSTYECTTFEGKKGWGRTFIDAIEDSTKSAEDPTKWDYIPPEFR